MCTDFTVEEKERWKAVLVSVQVVYDSYTEYSQVNFLSIV